MTFRRTAVHWRVPFKYEPDGFAGEMIVLARAEWRAKMACAKKLHRQGWKRAMSNGEARPNAPADVLAISRDRERYRSSRINLPARTAALSDQQNQTGRANPNKPAKQNHERNKN